MSSDFQIFIYRVVLSVVTWQKAVRTAHTGPQSRSAHEGAELGGELELIWERENFFVVSALRWDSLEPSRVDTSELLNLQISSPIFPTSP